MDGSKVVNLQQSKQVRVSESVNTSAINNRQVLLKSRPTGIPQAENFELAEGSISALNADEVLVRNIYWSVEPAMRGWICDTGNYSEPVPVGSVMRSFSTGVVIESKHPDYRSGDHVTGMFGWQEYAVAAGDSVMRSLSSERVPLSTSLGVLGLNGLTAYFGLLEVAEPRPEDTVVVSTAAGSVGSCVGQIAALKGCRTIGITGGAEKVQICRSEFGFDHAIDYKSDSFQDQLADVCKSGVDVYFDNTAGAISDAVMARLNRGARIVVCGTASIAEWNPLPTGPRVNRQLLVARARMQGVLVLDYADRYQQALVELEQWIANGDIAYREDILRGAETAPDAIAGLYRGENLGKRLIQVAETDGSDLV